MRAFDSLQVPTLPQYLLLRALGFEVTMQYTRVWTQAQVGAAKSIGLAILPLIQEGPPQTLAYFTYAQGQADAQRFLAWATAVGMPAGFPFCASVDFDCPADAVPTVLVQYANGLVDGVAGRNPVWMYGSWDVIEGMKQWAGVAGFIQAQASAWSQGRNANPHPLADSVQVGGATVAGVALDIQVFRSAAALWR